MKSPMSSVLSSQTWFSRSIESKNETPPRPNYKEHNSFIKIRKNQRNTLVEATDRFANVRQRGDLTEKMSEVHRQIFDQACIDLLDYNSSEIKKGRVVNLAINAVLFEFLSLSRARYYFVDAS